VDDNRADVVLLRTALNEIRADVNLYSVLNAAQALDFLHQRGEYSNAPVCDLVLLDLNMPGMDGHQLLDVMKADEKLRHSLVVVWTSSRNNGDVLRAYSNGAKAYYSKRNNYNETVALVQSIVEHWFGAVQLPTL
jgi:CheY-like chemotaxis protein